MQGARKLPSHGSSWAEELRLIERLAEDERRDTATLTKTGQTLSSVHNKKEARPAEESASKEEGSSPAPAYDYKANRFKHVAVGLSVGVLFGVLVSWLFAGPGESTPPAVVSAPVHRAVVAAEVPKAAPGPIGEKAVVGKISDESENNTKPETLETQKKRAVVAVKSDKKKRKKTSRKAESSSPKKQKRQRTGLDALLDDTLSGVGRETASSEEDAVSDEEENEGKPRLTRDDISKGLGRVQKAVKACGRKHQTSGMIPLKITVGANGRVSSAKASKAAEAEPCIVKAVSRARFPRLSTEQFTFSYAFLL